MVFYKLMAIFYLYLLKKYYLILKNERLMTLNAMKCICANLSYLHKRIKVISFLWPNFWGISQREREVILMWEPKRK